MRRKRAAAAERQPSAEVLAEFAALADRAREAGRPLRPVPTLVLGRDSRAVPGSPVRVQLNADLDRPDAVDRAWTLAHELAHALRWQEGLRPAVQRRVLMAAVLASLMAVLGAVAPVLLGSRWQAFALVPLAIVGVDVLWLCKLAVTRQNETETDALTAAVFGQVLTEAGVRRLNGEEGRGVRHLPDLLRAHARPESRRRIGLAAYGVGVSCAGE